MELRYYQKNAVKGVLSYLKANPTKNPCIEAPTGAGKTPIIATLCDIFSKTGARTLCVAHRKELLEQTAEKLKTWSTNVSCSIVSAGLNERDFSGQVVIAGIQSVYKSANRLLEHGKIDFLIVDEAHLIPATEENADGMYQSLIRDLRAFNPRLHVIGLTATPYRLNSGSVCGEDKILTEIAYKIGIPELIANKYLSPLINKVPTDPEQTFDFHIEHGEFKTSEVDEQFNVESVVHAACKRIAQLTKNRKSVLVFCCSKGHCKAVAKSLQEATGDEVGIVLGETPAGTRETLLRRFKGVKAQTSLFGDTDKPLKYLCNIDVLTTGFDATNVDCVVLLRPTASPGLYCQMVGRGLRLHEGKENCLILDFGGNLQRFGAIDEVKAPTAKTSSKQDKDEEDKPKKKICPICFEAIDPAARICPCCGNKLKCDDFCCPSCNTPNDISSKFCTECGFQFQAFSKHDEHEDVEHSIISAGNKLPVIEEDVLRVQYYEHHSRKSGKNSLRIEITTPTLTLQEYACFEHEGFPLQNAFKFWKERSEIRPIPFSVKQAYEIIQTVGIAEPTRIKYLPKKPGQYAPKIVWQDVKPKQAPGIYPRTDNPLNMKCYQCGGESFLYEKFPKSVYQVKCALCGGLISEFSPENMSDQELEHELEELKKLGITFYYADDGSDEFYQLGGINVNDIPF